MKLLLLKPEVCLTPLSMITGTISLPGGSYIFKWRHSMMNPHKGSPNLHLCYGLHPARTPISNKRESETLPSFPWEVTYVLHCRRAGNRLAHGTGECPSSCHLNTKNLRSSYFYHSSSDFIDASYSYLKSNAYKQHTFRLLNLYINTNLSMANSSIDLRRFNGHLGVLA